MANAPQLGRSRGRSPGVVYSTAELERLMRSGVPLTQAYMLDQGGVKRRDIWYVEIDGRKCEVARRVVRLVLMKKMIVAANEVGDGFTPVRWKLAR